MVKFGPALCKPGNLVPWSAPVARVHPRTADHRKFPYRVRPYQDTSMAMEWGGGGGGHGTEPGKSLGGRQEVRARG